LNTFLSASELSAGWVLNTATGINDKGWIVGTATCGSFVVCGVYSDAFVLMPVPEPEGYALALAGMGVVGFAARRRRVLGFLS
jgi:MYXO-CTERM domain-containing protein